jgi:hypothetical protein
MSTVHFDYAQARVQARFGTRPDEHIWLRLQGIGEIGSYLQAARQTGLRRWVLGISPAHDSHDIELALRQKFRTHIDEVANWPPQPWRAALRWLKCLPDLPAIQHLLDGGAATAWMRRDPALAVYTDAASLQPPQSLPASDTAILAKSLQQGDTPFQSWLQHWRELQPKPDRTCATFQPGMRQLEDLLCTQLTPTTGATTPMLREALALRLRATFRRYSFQPAAVSAYLALTALDLERLRGDLLQRALFSAACETSL